MRTPSEVWHLLESSISEFPLKQFVDMRRQEVANLKTARKHESHVSQVTFCVGGARSAHLRVQQVEVVHGLLHLSWGSDLWFATLRTNQLIDTLLFNCRREKGLKTGLTQEAGAMSHGDDLQKVQTERMKAQRRLAVTTSRRGDQSFTWLKDTCS